MEIEEERQSLVPVDFPPVTCQAFLRTGGFPDVYSEADFLLFLWERVAYGDSFYV